MAIKKFLSLEKLTEYDELIKDKIITNHYTKTEVDDKLAVITISEIDEICETS